MKGRQTDSLLRRFSSVSKIQQPGRKAAATTSSTMSTKTKLESKLDTTYERNKLYKVKKTMLKK